MNGLLKQVNKTNKLNLIWKKAEGKLNFSNKHKVKCKTMPFHIRQTIGTGSLIHGTPVVSSVGVTMPGAFSTPHICHETMRHCTSI